MTVWIDRILGRVTMYRLILIVLVVIGIVAVGASSLGVIFYSPQAIVVSAAVAVVVSYGSNRLIAALWRVRPHGESSLITALLLLFLLSPALDGRSLGALALAVVAANLSKYVLAWRGRHLFNPVAAGAVIIMLTQLTGATWWVATPVLLPVIVLGGLVVLYRAHAWDLAVPMVVIAVVGITLRLVAGGTDPGTAVWSALTSYPYLFFAAFLVSEPLTAPPRHWQRILVGVVIGAVVLVPINIGFFAMSPEVALLVGNLVAFAFGQRRRVRLALEARRELPGSLLELAFRPERPLRFRAGQWVELSLPHHSADARGARRVFSIANRPGADGVLIATRTARPESSFKTALGKLQPGETVAGSAVGGDFVLPRAPRTPLLWIAGGIGITPFVSFADHLGGGGSSAETSALGTDAVLVWAIRDADDLAYADVFERAGVRALVVGPAALGAASALPAGWTYLGADLGTVDLRSAIPDAAARRVYVAGSPRIVRAGRLAARAAGARRIRTDRFVGY